MATTTKTFLDDDITSTKTLLHENIPLTGSLIKSALYGMNNIKSYASHGMFQSVYDYSWQSASSNQLFDMTVGVTAGSPGSSSLDAYAQKKVNIYNQMAQILAGFDTTGSILQFDANGDYSAGSSEDKYNAVFILNFNRLLVKDEIKKGNVEISLGMNQSANDAFGLNNILYLTDYNGDQTYQVNSPTGEYGILYCHKKNGATNIIGSVPDNQATNITGGLIFYQAGVAVIPAHIFGKNDSTSPTLQLSQSNQGLLANAVAFNVTSSGGSITPYTNIAHLIRSGTIDQINDGLRSRIQNIKFLNTTELNSTIHFCRVNHNEFNYSSNPTYLKDSKIVVKGNNPSNAPISYITTVGLYSPDNELLAVAKLSQPIRKDPTQELILRVRLDY